jgi:Skp family chaperone for outer membrane proteins
MFPMKSHMLAGLAGLSLIALAGPAMAAPAAPAATAPKLQIVPGLAVVNAPEVVAASSAFKAANQERQATYKTQIEAAQAREQQINAQLQPLVEKFNRDRQSGSVSQAALQQQAQTIQNMRQSGQQELQTTLAPVRLSQAYVEQQINAVYNQAVSNAMAKHGISMVLPLQNGMFYNNTGGYNLNPAVVAELNALLPAAKVVPPEGWQPGQPIPSGK